MAGNVEAARRAEFTVGTAEPGDSVDVDVIAAVVPGTLSLTLGGPVTLGPFVPGVEREYTGTTFLTATSTLRGAQLTVSELGHMTNGATALPEPLRAELSRSVWTEPLANERVDVTFKQLVKRTDRLLEGSYAKRVRFTLATTTP